MEFDFDVDDVITQWGEYETINPGMTSMHFVEEQEGSLLDHARRVYTEKDQYRALIAEGSRILQAFQPSWTPLGSLTLSPVAILKAVFKVDWENAPIETLYTNFFSWYRTNGEDPASHPYALWILVNYIMPQVFKDLKIEMWNGEKLAIVPGTAAVAGAGMDGLSVIIADTHTAGLATALATGALATDPEAFCTQVENWFKTIPSPWRAQIEKIFMSEDLEQRYKDGYHAKYKLDPERAGKDAYNAAKIFGFAKVSVIGIEEAAGSERIFATVPDNFVVVYDKPTENDPEKAKRDPGRYVMESLKRMLYIYTQFRLGLGFDDPRILFANELD